MWSRLLVVTVCGALTLAGCRSSEPVVDPDTVFGHRYEPGEVPGDRQRAEITPPPPEADYFVYDAVIDSVFIRPEPPVVGQSGARPVEVLILGSLPDVCYELHSLEQESAGNLLTVRLMMRRSRGEICAQIIGRYRFHFLLQEPLVPGAYTLRLNDRVEPFVVVRPPPPGADGR